MLVEENETTENSAMVTLICCQDHMLEENIWVVWSETSCSGDERRCDRCGTNKQIQKVSRNRRNDKSLENHDFFKGFGCFSCFKALLNTESV